MLLGGELSKGVAEDRRPTATSPLSLRRLQGSATLDVTIRTTIQGSALGVRESVGPGMKVCEVW
jgi:hypothetical protein